MWFMDKTAMGMDKTEQTRLSEVKKRVQDLILEMETFYRYNATYERYLQRKKSYSKNLKTMHIEESPGATDHPLNPLFTFNALQANVETAHSKLVKNKPKVSFLTKGASAKYKSAAGKLDRYFLKLFKKIKIYQEGSMTSRDSCITGLGILKFFIDKLKFKRLYYNRFFCSDSGTGECRLKEAGDWDSYDRWKIIEMYPQKELQIKKKYQEEKKIRVYEIYYKEKKKCIFTDELILDYSDWHYDVPYELLNFIPGVQGVLGVGVCEKIFHIQEYITYMLDKIAKSIRRFAIPTIIVGKNSSHGSIVKMLTNQVAQLLEFNFEKEGSGPPQYITPPIMSDQYFDFLHSLWEKTFEIVGVNRLMSHGQIPPGLQNASGAALRSYQQIDIERFEFIRENYENLYIRCAKRIIKTMKKQGKTEQFTGIDKKTMEELMSNITIWVSNLLPETPAGQLSLSSELYNSNLVTKSQALSLIDSKDTQAFIDSSVSIPKTIDLLINKALSMGKTPDFKKVLGVGNYLERSRLIYCSLIQEDDDDKKIQIMDKFIEFLEGVYQKLKISLQGSMPPTGPQGGQEPQGGELTANADQYAFGPS